MTNWWTHTNKWYEKNKLEREKVFGGKLYNELRSKLYKEINRREAVHSLEYDATFVRFCRKHGIGEDGVFRHTDLNAWDFEGLEKMGKEIGVSI